MSIIGGALQQPHENLDYDIRYEEFLNENDTISTVDAVVIPDSDLQATAQIADPDRVKVWVNGGTSGNTYKVEVTIETMGGRRKQDEFEVYIEEI